MKVLDDIELAVDKVDARHLNDPALVRGVKLVIHDPLGELIPIRAMPANKSYGTGLAMALKVRPRTGRTQTRDIPPCDSGFSRVCRKAPERAQQESKRKQGLYLRKLGIVTAVDSIIAFQENVTQNGFSERVVFVIEVVEALERVVSLGQ